MKIRFTAFELARAMSEQLGCAESDADGCLVRIDAVRGYLTRSKCKDPTMTQIFNCLAVASRNLREAVILIRELRGEL